MHGQSLLLLVPFYLASLAAARPLQRTRAVGNGLNTLLFDSPAAISDSGTTVSAEVFAFTPVGDTSGLKTALSIIAAPLKLAGIDTDNDIDTALGRLQLFAATPEKAQSITLDIDGCSTPGVVGATDKTGVSIQNVDIGKCGDGTSFSGQAAGVSSNDSSPLTIFPSADSGFGVISDIDDTTKISDVLHKVKLIQNTLFEDAQPVPGMPELFANLSQSLNNPSFTFVTGSTFPLVPFLRDFIHTSYAATPGPILAKNITLGGLINLASNIFEGEATKDHKLAQIQRLSELWPNKSFLTIGDSGEQDPETYGQAFRTHGADVIKCIWIRKLNDTAADNSDARFAAAFQGVPQEKIRLYSDDDIVNVLPGIDVAGGSC